MGLKRFDNNLPTKKKSIKQIIVVLCICLVAVISVTSYAIFQVRHSKPIADAKVGKFKNSDIVLEILIDGEKSETFPEKESNKVFQELTCTNGGVAEWDSDAWELSIIDISGPTECTVSFVTPENPFANDTSNANEPKLNNGMIPVIYNGTDWVKADITKPWYNYDKQLWANAVTVSASSRNIYTNAAANTPISMDDIETMWVWIPRYEYQHTNLSADYAGGTKEQPGPITINFISKDTMTPSSSNFTIHPAFGWDAWNLGSETGLLQQAGIWVAKFEMSTGSTSCTPTTKSAGGEGCNLQTIHPFIKPNETSWRGAQIGTFWTVIKNEMYVTGNSYGITNAEPHLMKNIEWGAVAYLTQSKYGKYGNPDYTGLDKEVAINNCSNFITGIGGDTVSASSSSTTCTTNTYETEKGQAASTTGNIYGIYDMSGGANEYVMGIMKANGSEEPAVGYQTYYDSGWTGKYYNNVTSGTIGTSYGPIKNIGSKYYDLYDYDGSIYIATKERAHLGDATYEVIASDSNSTHLGWYSDYEVFVNSITPFFIRGGVYSNTTMAGITYFSAMYGYASVNISSRPVIVMIS